MKWITLLPLFFLLSACIYTEGQIISEPEDIVVSPKAYQLPPWDPCQGTDVTNPERQRKCTK